MVEITKAIPILEGRRNSGKAKKAGALTSPRYFSWSNLFLPVSNLSLTYNQTFFFPGKRESVAARESVGCSGREKGRFFLPSQDHRLSRCHTFALPRIKERLITGYFFLVPTICLLVYEDVVDLKGEEGCRANQIFFTLRLFYMNLFYKNVEAEINQNFKSV